MQTGIELIAEERQRQIQVEGYDRLHDESYKNGELVGAAMCYASESINKDFPKERPKLRAQLFIPSFSKFFTNPATGKVDQDKWIEAWPWDDEYDKREKHDKLRCLVIAGALIAAEIDRLNRSK